MFLKNTLISVNKAVKNRSTDGGRSFETSVTSLTCLLQFIGPDQVVVVISITRLIGFLPLNGSFISFSSWTVLLLNELRQFISHLF